MDATKACDGEHATLQAHHHRAGREPRRETPEESRRAGDGRRTSVIFVRKCGRGVGLVLVSVPRRRGGESARLRSPSSQTPRETSPPETRARARGSPPASLTRRRRAPPRRRRISFSRSGRGARRRSWTPSRPLSRRARRRGSRPRERRERQGGERLMRRERARHRDLARGEGCRGEAWEEGDGDRDARADRADEDHGRAPGAARAEGDEGERGEARVREDGEDVAERAPRGDAAGGVVLHEERLRGLEVVQRGEEEEERELPPGAPVAKRGRDRAETAARDDDGASRRGVRVKTRGVRGVRRRRRERRRREGVAHLERAAAPRRRLDVGGGGYGPRARRGAGVSSARPTVSRRR